MAVLGTFLGIIVALALVVVGYIISTQRTLVNLDEMCKNALSQIEVQLNSRFDAVIALAKTAAQYAAHESETIIQTIQARGGNAPANTPAAINEQSDLLGQMIGRLNVVVEQYPELKASELYIKAQEGQREYEEKVRISRMVYNDTATKMNRMVRQWPSSWLKTGEPWSRPPEAVSCRNSPFFQNLYAYYLQKLSLGMIIPCGLN